MPRRWVWIDKLAALAIHDRQLAEHGGRSGLLDEGRLEAALARPRNIAAYKIPDAAALAATYAFGIVKNHPFADGNKRVGWVLARLFLARNGYALKFDATDAICTVQALAAGTITEAKFAKWLRERISR